MAFKNSVSEKIAMSLCKSGVLENRWIRNDVHNSISECSTISLAAAEIWNQKAENSADIYYKLTAYLNGLYKDSADIRQSCAQARGQTEPLRLSLQGPHRTNKIVDATSGPLVPHRVNTGFEPSFNSAGGSRQVQFHGLFSTGELNFFSSMLSTVSASKVLQFAETHNVPLAAATPPARSTIEISQKRSADGEPAGIWEWKQGDKGVKGIGDPDASGTSARVWASPALAKALEKAIEARGRSEAWTASASDSHAGGCAPRARGASGIPPHNLSGDQDKAIET
ncbi:hypothetical protein B0H13DRAFT_1903295 [Mycena leptocephala]|nr:hypothetical protein B0H13DRAFT_1903295 [Mycena leptocephala]